MMKSFVSCKSNLRLDVTAFFVKVREVDNFEDLVYDFRGKRSGPTCPRAKVSFVWNETKSEHCTGVSSHQADRISRWCVPTWFMIRPLMFRKDPAVMPLNRKQGQTPSQV
ncbi:hypothetical protein RRG08_061576 [Elysia crispata]|uniref:Uncharacterized protein n=1 Tax=Elysia crispata TaxID=231223 RepID=A0AAE0YTK5_9GAST|nr:hypothetical protein RRG08_061576 [Elysia crispata]